jgi:hypothetical protein
VDRERAEQLQTEVMFTREVLRIGQELTEALKRLNESIAEQLTNPRMVLVSQANLGKALEANQALVALATGRAKMLQEEFDDIDL